MNYKKLFNKELAKLNKTIGRFVESFGCNFGGMSTDFHCYCGEDDAYTVFYSILTPVDTDKRFLDMFANDFHIENVGIFTLSLLHEIGHCFTYQNLSKNDIKFCNESKKIIDRMKNREVKDKEYFHLPDELMASAWAAGFIENNRKEVLHFDNLMKKELKRFYRKCLTELSSTGIINI